MKDGLGPLGKGPCYTTNMLYPTVVAVLGGKDIIRRFRDYRTLTLN